MRLLPLVLLVISPLVLARGPDIDKVNGSIRTDEGREYGNLETVNGAISVAPGVMAEEVSTVNGSIVIRESGQVDSVETVNGSISIEENAVVRRHAETVNGAITLDRGARIEDGAETVNGGLRLRGAEVGKDLRTVNGSIEVLDGAIVHGNIVVEKPKGWFNFGTRQPPRVTIGENAVVKGELRFEQEVELRVHSSAKIGPIRGVEPKRLDDGAVER